MAEWGDVACLTCRVKSSLTVVLDLKGVTSMGNRSYSKLSFKMAQHLNSLLNSITRLCKILKFHSVSTSTNHFHDLILHVDEVQIVSCTECPSNNQHHRNNKRPHRNNCKIHPPNLILLLLRQRSTSPLRALHRNLHLFRRPRLPARENVLYKLLNFAARSRNGQEVWVRGSRLAVNHAGVPQEDITYPTHVGALQEELAGLPPTQFNVALEDERVAVYEGEGSDGHYLGDGAEVEDGLVAQDGEVD
jgi:hypothetical protein